MATRVLERSRWMWTCTVFLAAGCIGATRQEGDGSRDPREESESAEVQIHLDGDEGRLARGREAAAMGNYSQALSEFDALSRDVGAKPELRSQALYQAALVQSNALNARRDPQQAAAKARQLLAEYPKSEWRDEAEALLQTLGTPANPAP